MPCRTYTPGSPGAQWKRLRSKSGLGVVDRQSESPARPAVPSLLPSSVPGSSLSRGAERLAECASVAAQANTLTNCYHRRRCSSSLSKWTLPLRSLLIPSREPLGMGLGEPAIRFPLQVASCCVQQDLHLTRRRRASQMSYNKYDSVVNLPALAEPVGRKRGAGLLATAADRGGRQQWRSSLRFTLRLEPDDRYEPLQQRGGVWETTGVA